MLRIKSLTARMFLLPLLAAAGMAASQDVDPRLAESRDIVRDFAASARASVASDGPFPASAAPVTR